MERYCQNQNNTENQAATCKRQNRNCPYFGTAVQYGFIAGDDTEGNILGLFMSHTSEPKDRCRNYTPLDGTVQGLIKKLNGVVVK